MRDVQRALDIERDHPVPLVDRALECRTEQHDPGVVDDDVEPAELGGAVRSTAATA